MKKLHLNIELLEDLHIGTGTGLGDIDALQVRDRDDLPVLPSSHIKGLLLQAARELMTLQPEAIRQSDIDTLFGRPGSGNQGCVQLTSAYLVKHSNHGANATVVWGSTRIDPEKGKAQNTSLRKVEYVAVGSNFALQAYLPDKYKDLLKTIIGRCVRLGSGRSRGYGLVQWQLKNPDIGTLKPLQIPHETPTYPQRLRLLLSNLDPVCLAQTGHPGNLISSEAFIRGRALRGSFAAACITLGQPEWAQTLLQADLAWGDAMPLPLQENEFKANDLQTYEVLPIPLSIGTPKATATQTSLPWWALQQKTQLLGARGETNQINPSIKEQQTEKLKRPAANEYLFRRSPDDPWQRYTPQMQERLRTHVARPEVEDEQALFTNEEIAEHTLFLADLVVTSAAQAKTLGQLVHALDQQWLRVGRGGKPLEIKAAKWIDVKPCETPANNTTGNFTLLLLSDLIARDPLGNFHDRITAQALCQLTGLPVNCHISIEKNYSEGCNLYGFNALTGLPRMAQRGIKAGSIASINGADAAKLRTALAGKHFLGESPDEGFGRFVLDMLFDTDTTKSKTPATPISPQSPRHEELCKQAQTLATKYASAIAKPSASQWGDFRNQVQAARNRTELMAVFARIDAAAGKQGGKAWAGLAGDKSHDLREKVKELPLPDAQDLLDYFVRWQRVQRNIEQGKKEHRA